MKLNRIGDNVTELHFMTLAAGNVSLIVLFSYQTPVAARLPDGQMVKTETRHSVTTSRHVGQFVSNYGHAGEVKEMPQSFFDGLMDGGASYV